MCGLPLVPKFEFWHIFPLALLAAIASEALVVHFLVLLVNSHLFSDSLAFVIWLLCVGVAGFFSYWACFHFLCKLKPLS